MDENPTDKVIRKTTRIINECRQTGNESVIDVLDFCKQSLLAKSKRLKRFKESQQRRNENYLFENDERGFYRSLNNNMDCDTAEIEVPSDQRINEFWSSIWSNPINHEENATWIANEKMKYNDTIENMNTFDIAEEDVKLSLKTKANWKSPGVYGIHNFWLKKFKTTHKHIAHWFNRFLNDSARIPSFMTEGITYLLPKTNVRSADPSKYRPITCLPTLYKLLTSLITDAIYAHIDTYNILSEEQKGCKRGSQGCKEQLIIDGFITSQAKRKKRSLHVAYIDYQKAFDSVPHSWLFTILEMYKVDENLVRFLKILASKWNTNLMVKTGNGMRRAANIQINRGIFQGDSLSALWFCLAINPLSSLLNGTGKGYKIKGLTTNIKINHLLYMDDIKLFADNRSNLDNLLKTTELFSNDIRMSFGIDKCKIQSTTRGRPVQTEDYILNSLQHISVMEEMDIYKYLGYYQSTGIDQKAAKNMLKDKFMKRFRLIAKSKLSARNKTKAINTYAIPVLIYSFGILKWSSTELQQINMDMRTLSSKFRMHHPRSSVERFHLPRSKGGRGIIDIHVMHNQQLNNLREFFYKKTASSPAHKVIAETDGSLTALKLLDRSFNPNANSTSEIQKIERWLEKELHGRYPAQLKKDFIDERASLMWLQNGNIFAETEGFVLAIQDQVIATKNYRKYIIKDTSLEDDKCRICKQQPENLDHIIGGCSVLAPTDYTRRHNNVAKIIHQEICFSYGIVRERVPYYKYQPANVIDTENCKIYWDRCIITDLTIPHNRPDIVCVDKMSRNTFLIDITIPLANNISKKYGEKMEKYLMLATEIKEMWNQERVTVVPIVIGALGEIPISLDVSLKTLGLKPGIYTTLQKIAILETASIVRRVLSGNITS